jgi:hypothetical protein
LAGETGTDFDAEHGSVNREGNPKHAAIALIPRDGFWVVIVVNTAMCGHALIRSL